MKLLYKFEIKEMDEELFAVPVGDNRSRFHGMMRMNQAAAEMLQLIQEHSSPEAVLEVLLQRYPDMEKDDLGWELCSFMNHLITEGILDPEG